MKDGETWGDARSTRNQANTWIKINKTISNQQITRKLGYFLWGFSKFRTKSRKRRLEDGGRDSKDVIKVAPDTHDTGLTRCRPIFHVWSESLEEHDKHGEEQGEITRGNTQEQVQSHIH